MSDFAGLIDSELFAAVVSTARQSGDSGELVGAYWPDAPREVGTAVHLLSSDSYEEYCDEIDLVLPHVLLSTSCRWALIGTEMDHALFGTGSKGQLDELRKHLAPIRFDPARAVLDAVAIDASNRDQMLVVLAHVYGANEAQKLILESMNADAQKDQD